MPIQVIECGVQSWVQKLKVPKRRLANPSSIQKKTKTKHAKKKAKESIHHQTKSLITVAFSNSCPWAIT
jgi:hypothetical protein